MTRSELESKVLILMNVGASKEIASLIVDLVWAARREGSTNPILDYQSTSNRLGANSELESKIGSPSALPLRSVSDPIRSDLTLLPGLEADPERAHVSLNRRKYNTMPRPEGFDAFWAVYPRHEAKQAAIRAWTRLNPSNPILELIMESINRQRIGMIQRGLEYAPYASTWLNGKRWEDEQVVQPAPLPVARNFREEANRAAVEGYLAMRKGTP